QRLKVNDQLNSLQFYNIVAPIVAFTKEDHCDIHLSQEVNGYLSVNGLFLPIFIKTLGKETYILNDLVIGGKNLKGFRVAAINGKSIDQIKNRLYNTFAADGYIES